MKVITVSCRFPGYHPKKGSLTFFIEKIQKSLGIESNIEIHGILPKHHTIRKGTRWKKGEMASLRYWSGRPYFSKQIEIVQVKIVQVKYITIANTSSLNIVVNQSCLRDYQIEELAENDGLLVGDLWKWFVPNPKKFNGFVGQIICWTPVNQY